MKTLAQIREAIEAKKTRGAWATGVKAYALELIEEAEERSAYEGSEPETERQLENYMLNGADSWKQYSWGGCSLIYDFDICDRLSNNTEKKITRNGERRPNAREEWLDVQARALFQASRLVIMEAREA